VKKLTRAQKNRVRKWVEVLESGKYKQGRNALKQDRKFCCLGVATDLYMKTTKKGRWDWDVNGKDTFVSSGGFKVPSLLPKEVEDWLGLSSPDGAFRKSPRNLFQGHSNLADLNDNHRLNFKSIARVVRIVWLGEKLPLPSKLRSVMRDWNRTKRSIDF